MVTHEVDGQDQAPAMEYQRHREGMASLVLSEGGARGCRWLGRIPSARGNTAHSCTSQRACTHDIKQTRVALP